MSYFHRFADRLSLKYGESTISIFLSKEQKKMLADMGFVDKAKLSLVIVGRERITLKIGKEPVWIEPNGMKEWWRYPFDEAVGSAAAHIINEFYYWIALKVANDVEAGNTTLEDLRESNVNIFQHPIIQKKVTEQFLNNSVPRASNRPSGMTKEIYDLLGLTDRLVRVSEYSLLKACDIAIATAKSGVSDFVLPKEWKHLEKPEETLRSAYKRHKKHFD